MAKTFYRLYTQQGVLMSGLEFTDGIVSKAEHKISTCIPWLIGAKLADVKDYWERDHKLIMRPKEEFLDPLEFSKEPSESFIEVCFWLNCHYKEDVFVEIPYFAGAPKKYSKKLNIDEIEWIQNNL